MRTYGIRELQRRTSALVREVQATGEAAVITRHGSLAAVLVPVDEDALEEFVFAHVPEFATSLREAASQAERGEHIPEAELDALIEGLPE